MPQKTKYWETGPGWEMVEQWIKNYQDTHKRKLTITLGYHEFKNGYSGLFVSALSYKPNGKGGHEHSFETCWYWPNKRYVSLPAMVIGVITEHDKMTPEWVEKFGRMKPPAPVEELPLFK